MTDATGIATEPVRVNNDDLERCNACGLWFTPGQTGGQGITEARVLEGNYRSPACRRSDAKGDVEGCLLDKRTNAFMTTLPPPKPDDLLDAHTKLLVALSRAVDARIMWAIDGITAHKPSDKNQTGMAYMTFSRDMDTPSPVLPALAALLGAQREQKLSAVLRDAYYDGRLTQAASQCPACKYWFVPDCERGMAMASGGESNRVFIPTCKMHGISPQGCLLDERQQPKAPPLCGYTTIERIARALCEYQGNDPDKVHSSTEGASSCVAWRYYVPEVVIAIQCLRGKGGELHPLAMHFHAFEPAFKRSFGPHGYQESVMAGINAVLDSIMAEKP